MYRLIVIVFTLFVNAIVFLATSFWTNVGDSADNAAYNEKVAYYEEALGVDMEFVCRVPETEEGRSAGMLKYIDDTYEYHYNDEIELLDSITRLDCSETTSDKVLTQEELQVLAEKLFVTVMGSHIVGNLQFTAPGHNGIGYQFFCDELVNGYKTGTSGYFIVGEDGTLYLATFTLGNQYDISPEEMLTEQEAFELTKAYLDDVEDRNPIWTLYYSDTSTWHGVSVWEIVVEASQDNYGYLVRLDAYNGEILYCEFCMF